MCANIRAAVRLPVLPGLARVAVGRGDADHVHQQRLVDLAIQLDVPDGECAERFTVVAVGERDEAALGRAPGIAPVVEAHLERHLDRARAVVGIETARQARRGKRSEPLGKLDRRCVREACQHHVLEAAELARDRGADARVGVAEQVDPPRADRVEVAAAVGVVEPHALAALDGDHRQPLVVLHLRARVPDGVQIATGEIGRGGHRHTGAGAKPRF
jgi:hypothetical protein